MDPTVDHIQITVQDMSVAIPFYDALMPLLGFDLADRSEATVTEHEFHVVEYRHPDLTLGINSPRAPFADEAVHRRKPGALHHLAFRAASRGEVDRMHDALREIGAEIVDGPRLFPEHGERYYAVFFKDPGGLKFEVMIEGPE